jgi:hypothetical protein
MAIAVTMLGGARPASTPVAVESTPRGPASAGTPRLDEAALADALAAEFSTSDSRVDAAAGGSARQPSTDGSGAAAPGQADDAALPGDETTTLRRTATGATAAPGTGREAGSTRDDSAPGAGSRAAPGSMLVQRRDVSGSADDDERLADDERVASYADESTARATAAGVIVDAAAARPPAARREARLSPAEAAYVANWRADLRTADQEQR